MRPLQLLVVSLLLSLISTLVLSRTGGVLSHRDFSTHRIPQSQLRNLCSHIMLAVCSLSSTLQRTQPSFRLFISLGSAEPRILPAAPADASHLILHWPATDSLRRSLFGNCLSLYDLWGVSRLLGLHGLLPCPQSSEGVGQSTTNPLLCVSVNRTGFFYQCMCSCVKNRDLGENFQQNVYG